MRTERVSNFRAQPYGKVPDSQEHFTLLDSLKSITQMTLENNALSAAFSGGGKEVVRMLLENGADVNAQGGQYGNALQAASCGGHQEVVQILLEKGADVNAQGGEYGNALHAASSRGHKRHGHIAGRPLWHVPDPEQEGDTAAQGLDLQYLHGRRVYFDQSNAISTPTLYIRLGKLQGTAA